MLARLKKLLGAVQGEIELRDVFVFSGLGCAAYGAALVFPPAGWIVAGVALFWLGVRKA